MTDFARLIAELEKELAIMRATLTGLIEKWQAKKYDGDYTQAVYHICADELRQALKGEPK